MTWHQVDILDFGLLTPVFPAFRRKSKNLSVSLSVEDFFFQIIPTESCPYVKPPILVSSRHRYCRVVGVALSAPIELWNHMRRERIS